MILVIAEKPSVAQSIAKVLGATSRKDGYMEGGNYIVSWCFGHLVELADASSYDERYAKWRYDDLPIVPESWMFEVTKDKAQQFKVLSALMKDKRVTELVCATDAGREGELIFRLVYDKAGCTKPFSYPAFSPLPAGIPKIPCGRSFSVTLPQPHGCQVISLRGALRCPDFPLPACGRQRQSGPAGQR